VGLQVHEPSRAAAIGFSRGPFIRHRSGPFPRPDALRKNPNKLLIINNLIQ